MLLPFVGRSHSRFVGVEYGSRAGVDVYKEEVTVLSGSTLTLKWASEHTPAQLCQMEGNPTVAGASPPPRPPPAWWGTRGCLR